MKDDEIAKVNAAAAAIQLKLPSPCVPGVIENQRIVDQHRARVAAFLAKHPEL